MNRSQSSSRLVALNGDNEPPLVRRSSVLPKENPLPGSELHPTGADGNDFAGPSERHLYMTRHIIRPFESVVKVRIVFGDETVEPTLKVSTGRRISVLHNDQATAGVLAEYRNGAGGHATGCHEVSDLSGNFNRPSSSS